jgi:hypothetical protein
MYRVPNDPNVMQTADGDRCRTCWLIGIAAKNQRRKHNNAIRAAATARIKAVKSVLGRPPKSEDLRQQQILGESEDRLKKIAYLESAIKGIEKNPRIALPGQLEQFRTRLLNLQRERDSNAAPDPETP